MTEINSVYSKYTMKSFRGNMRQDHVPEHSHRVDKGDMIFNRHKPEIDRYGKRPNLPIIY